LHSARYISPPPADHLDAYFRIEALGYEVFSIPRDIGWGDIPQEDWSIVVMIFLGDIDDSHQLLLIVPLPRRRRRLTRSGVILGAYKDGDIS
jgi:hypothetical protein